MTSVGTLAGLLRQTADIDPDKELVRFVGGPRLSAGALHEAAARTASYLGSLGVTAGERVAVMTGNRQELLWLHFGANHGGAASVLLGTDLKGPILAHMLTQSDPRAVVVEQRYVEAVDRALHDVPPAKRPQIVALDDGEDSELAGVIASAEPAPLVEAGPRALAMILYTSGTTGRSKGVMMSNGAAFGFADAVEHSLQLRRDDVAYSCLPLYHNNALSVTLVPALRTMSTAVFGPRFSARRFWNEVCDSGATVISLLGSMVPILWNRPPVDADRAHSVRIAMAVPAPTANFEAIQRRFGFQLASLYGMTDLGLPIMTPPEGARPGCAGVSQPGWECKIVDENDEEVPPGAPGELLARPSSPDVLPLGYWADADATVQSWRDLWFHTGDLLSRDEDGWFHFVDRKKDAMRRFGENISSVEVEMVLESHPDVAEAAVFAVPAELAEDEVMAAVVLVPGASAGTADLWTYCDDQLPYFAVPRYLDFRADLPRTATAKVQKSLLRAEGVRMGTQDRGPVGRRTREIR